MNITRRRFLTVSAAALATPGRAATRHDWSGLALGTAVRLRLSGASDHQALRVFRRVAAVLTQVEADFSLHRDSALARLNRDGRLAFPGEQMLRLCALADRVHRATGGAFDPSVQPLWLAMALGHDPAKARAALGWSRVRVATQEIRLDHGMALTFNGIAQGHAADRIADLMRDEGLENVLIDMGEVQALGHAPGGVPWRARIAGPDGTGLAELGLSNRALATSSPFGTTIGNGHSHILHPLGLPVLWQTASVSAAQAAVADALSTAACLMNRTAIDSALAEFPEARLEALS